MKTRIVDRWKYKNYFNRAKECAETACWSHQNEKWNACVINAIHAGISAADAFCIIIVAIITN